MTYIFTAPQLAGTIQQALKTDDPLVLENVAFLAELFYQDCKDDIKELTDQPWPERLAETTFEAYNYGAYEQTIRTNLDDLPRLCTIHNHRQTNHDYPKIISKHSRTMQRAHRIRNR